MFGYVTFYKPKLSEADFSIFKSYYCGLCKQLGKSYNQLIRLGLSYDFTFLAIVIDALTNDETKTEDASCIKHIGKKRRIVTDNSALKYSAAMSIALNYYKLTDDICDDKSIKALILRLPYAKQLKKLDKTFDILTDEISYRLKKLSKLERENCSNIDEISHEFSKIMESIFSYSISLKSFGYNLGKFIYILDAFDDLDEDFKNKKYNPLISKYNYKGTCEEKRNIVKDIDFILTYTLSQIAFEYEKQNIVKNKTLIDNIIYLGLRQKKDFILFKSEEK